MNIVDYMEQGILDSDTILTVSSPHSLVSTPVKNESTFAIIRGDKKIIPIFKDIAHVRPFLTIFRGVEFNSNNFDGFLGKLMSIITGDTSSILPQRTSQELEVRRLFERLKRLTAKLFNPNSETSYTFTSRLLRSQGMQDNFGITVRDQAYLDDQKVQFIEGTYYIIPNSKTLRIRRDTGEVETLLTRNNLIEIGEEEITNRLKRFFLDIANYVREDSNIEIS